MKARKCTKIRLTMPEAILALKVAWLARRNGDIFRKERDYYACPHCSTKGRAFYHTTSKSRGMLRFFSARLVKEFLLQFEPDPETERSYFEKVKRNQNKANNLARQASRRYGSGNRRRERRLPATH